MTILDRLVVREFFRLFFIFIMASPVLFILGDLTDNLDTYLDRRNGYRFEVNPNGVRWEGLFQNITEVEGNWEGIWEAKSQRDAEGWTTEIRIPFQSLSFNPASSEWGINFNRIRRGSNENIAWTSRPTTGGRRGRVRTFRVNAAAAGRTPRAGRHCRSS